MGVCVYKNIGKAEGSLPPSLRRKGVCKINLHGGGGGVTIFNFAMKEKGTTPLPPINN